MNKELKTIKWCTNCAKEHAVSIIDSGNDEKSNNNIFLKVFSPGKIRINRKYKCSRCLHEFNEASFNQAVIVPMLITLVLTITLLAFLYTVFYVI